MTPDLKQALAAKELLDEYNKNVRVIDIANLTDLGNAKRFVSMHQRNIRYVPPWKCWMVWNRKHWEGCDNSGMVPLVDEMIKAMYSEANGMISSEEGERLRKHAKATEAENRIMATIRLASSQSGIQATPDDFDKDKYLLNFTNGTVDMRTKTLKPFTREDMITRICAVPYVPGAKYELWQGFIEKIFNNDTDVIRYVQKFIGMAFTGDVSEELFHIFHGGGQNGKTTLLTSINNILGNGYFKNMAVETLLKRGQKAIANDIARLQGARVAWANEPEFDDVLTEGKIKKMVSKERILGEMKFKEPIEFEPEYSLILSTNPKPKIRGLSKGLRRRVRLIPFEVEITDAEKDIHFADKLRAELSGIAVWAIDGCIMWQKEGLIPPEKILQATDDYHQEMDQLSEFFNLFIIKDTQSTTPFILLYTVYKHWAEINDVYVMKEKAFAQVLIERGFKKITARYPDGRQFRGFASVTICEDVLKSVTEIFTSPDYERHDRIEALLPIIRMVSNPFHISATRAQDKTVTSVTSVTNDMQSHNTIFSQSVTSVTSVTKNKDILIKIKEKYDKLNKPDSIKDLQKLKETMELYILTELDTMEGIDDVDINRIIDDYLRGRQWQ